jgi:hypothetical protein
LGTPDAERCGAIDERTLVEAAGWSLIDVGDLNPSSPPG